MTKNFNHKTKHHGQGYLRCFQITCQKCKILKTQIGQCTLSLTRNISPPLPKRWGNTFGLHLNLSLKMGTNGLFAPTHMSIVTHYHHGQWNKKSCWVECDFAWGENWATRSIMVECFKNDKGIAVFRYFKNTTTL